MKDVYIFQINGHDFPEEDRFIGANKILPLLEGAWVSFEFEDDTDENSYIEQVAWHATDETDIHGDEAYGVYGKDIPLVQVHLSMDRMVIRIREDYVDKIKDVYDAYNMFWNCGDGYASYEKFTEDWNENELVKTNFETFRMACRFGWGLNVFEALLNNVYKDADVELVDMGTGLDLTY